MSKISSTAMILAAGLGTRMRPLSLQTPKPLLEVGGRTMLDRVLDKLSDQGIERAVVNTHYLAEQVVAHLSVRKDMEIIFSHEDMLLDSGGGVKKALPYFEGLPFFSINADLPWEDGGVASLGRMVAAWDDATMDALMLVMPTQSARGFSSKGDFCLEKDGRVWRKDALLPRPFVWLGVQIIKPAFFAARPEDVFSTNVVWDEIEARRRLFGIAHEGTCYHVGTPGDLAEANRMLESGAGWAL